MMATLSNDELHDTFELYGKARLRHQFKTFARYGSAVLENPYFKEPTISDLTEDHFDVIFAGRKFRFSMVVAADEHDKLRPTSL